jgi:hypothetical protein
MELQGKGSKSTTFSRRPKSSSALTFLSSPGVSASATSQTGQIQVKSIVTTSGLQSKQYSRLGTAKSAIGKSQRKPRGRISLTLAVARPTHPDLFSTFAGNDLYRFRANEEAAQSFRLRWYFRFFFELVQVQLSTSLSA